MNKYAYVERRKAVHPDASDTWELFIGRDVPGEQTFGAAQSAGYFNSPEEAMAYAKFRGARISGVINE